MTTTTTIRWGRSTTEGDHYESECRSKCGRFLIGATEAEAAIRIYNLCEWDADTQDHEELQGFSSLAEAKAQAARIAAKGDA